jgi:hypothetical protein
VNSLKNARTNDVIRTFEQETNGRWGPGETPWALSQDGIRKCTQALIDIANRTSSRATGLSFKSLFITGHRKKTHNYFSLGGPYGEQYAAGSRTDPYRCMLEAMASAYGDMVPSSVDVGQLSQQHAAI